MEEEFTVPPGAVAVIPTDTLYGLVASAHDVAAVERVYALKKRDPKKSCIVLIDCIARLEEFGIELTDELQATLARHWPGPVSIVIPVAVSGHEHLVRGNGSIAFRMPDDARIRAWLRTAGPLIAPSANPEGLPPATTIEEARAYFGSDVAAYLDGGTLEGLPSSLISIGSDGAIAVLRAGRERLAGA